MEKGHVITKIKEIPNKIKIIVAVSAFIIIAVVIIIASIVCNKKSESDVALSDEFITNNSNYSSNNSKEDITDENDSIFTDVALSDDEINEYANKDIVNTVDQLYTYDIMRRDIYTMWKLYPNLIHINKYDKTADGREIIEVILGNKDAKKHVLIQASIHGREYISTILVMKQMEEALKNMDSYEYNGVPIKDIFNNVAFHIVPMLNPDGVTISQLGLSAVNNEKIKENLQRYYERDLEKGFIATDLSGYLQIWKSNANGTDINKNFPHAWDSYGGPQVPSRLNYKGSAAESEPETKAIIDIVNNNNIVGGLAYHASGSVIYWDYLQTGELRDKCYGFAKSFQDLTEYMLYTSKDKKMTPAGFSDWLVCEKNIPALTVEVGKGSAPVSMDRWPNLWNANKEILYMMGDYFGNL